jgi:hypothetical protein
MKTLPDSPNLEHLRQQAKDLLPQLRTMRQGASLSDAQALVAEQYGFRTWPDLKAEVERRTAATGPIEADGSKAQDVAAAFDLGAPAGPMQPLTRQWAGQAWALTTDRGRWLTRRLFDWHDEAGVDTEVALAEAAVRAGITTLEPVRSEAGAIIERLGEERWRVYTLPPLGPDPTLPADPRHAAAAGRILGTLHALRLAPPGPVVPWISQVRPESHWRELQRAAVQQGMAWADRLGEAIPDVMDAYAVVEALDRAGEVVFSACHYAFATMGPDDLAVTTWEHAGATPVRWEFGSLLAGWSGGVRDAVNLPAASAFIAGYAEAAGDVPHPLTLGIFTSAVCANHSWLFTRIRLSLCAADADRRAVAAREVPWLLEHLPSRAQFEAVLDAIAPGAG